MIISKNMIYSFSFIFTITQVCSITNKSFIELLQTFYLRELNVLCEKFYLCSAKLLCIPVKRKKPYMLLLNSSSNGSSIDLKPV